METSSKIITITIGILILGFIIFAFIRNAFGQVKTSVRVELTEENCLSTLKSQPDILKLLEARIYETN